ncbi:MAG: MFS transporter [Actinomycetota bacterium]|nr:MFS transporter [Actinomycetota bacterium]
MVLLRGLAVDVSPLRSRDFRRLWLGQVITVIGTTMTLVAVPTQVYQITGRSLDVGITSIVALVPLVVFGLLGGAIADAMDRRVLLLITAGGTAVTSVLLWVQALLPGGGPLWSLWVLVAVQSGFFAVNSPTRSAVIPRLLPLEQVPSANALNMTVSSAGVIIGPLIAGLLIESGGLEWTYLIDAVGFAVALILLVHLPSMPPERSDPDAVRPGPFRSVREGFAFLRGRQILLMTFVVDLIAMIFGAPRALFPELAATTYAGGANALGWLFAGAAIGALLAGLLSGWLARVHRQGLVILVSIVVWGAAIALFGLTGSLPLAVFWLAVAGGADMVSAVFRSSILQTAAPDEMRGRMQGVFIVVVVGGPRLGDLRAGGMSAVSSPEVALVSGGVLIVAAMLVVALVVPSFRRYDARVPSP